MKLLSIMTLALIGAAVVGCGTRSYSDHDVVYRTPAYDDRYYYESNDAPGTLYYYRPGYGAVPVYRHGTICDEDDDCRYYRD